MQFPLSLVLVATLLFAARDALARPTRPFLSEVLAKLFGHRALLNLNGTATVTPGIQRFVVRYATAERWKAPVAASTLKTLSTLPPACPQPGDNGSEDCLYAVIYTPAQPTHLLVWVHGGSFIVGSASDPMIEGSRLAQATNAAVVVVQYRLGVLGFLPPSAGANGNLAVRDVLASLTFVNKVAAFFNLAAKDVTVAGQSSGATLVRALLAAPSASSLFGKAILHSDTADYGFSKPATLTKLQAAFFPGMANCAATNTACLQALSIDAILSAQDQIYAEAASIDPATAGPVPLRPIKDDSLITSTLTTSFPSSLKPIIITTVANDGGPSIFSPGSVPAGLPADMFAPVLGNIIADDRAQKIADSPFYTPTASASDDGVRLALSNVIGDLAFRCPDWILARAWAQRGGKVFTAAFTRGATHPANDGIDFCKSDPKHVCHQDEIPIVFGTARSPTAEQTQLISETQARLSAFFRTGDPNLTGAASLIGGKTISTWSQSKNEDAFTVLSLGGAPNEKVALGACTTKFWGTAAVPFDYQIHGL